VREVRVKEKVISGTAMVAAQGHSVAFSTYSCCKNSINSGFFRSCASRCYGISGRTLFEPTFSHWSTCGGKRRNRCFSVRDGRYDLVTLSNLCVDVIVPLEKLPEGLWKNNQSREDLLEYLTENPDCVSLEDSWEVGGNTNTLIAASRLGMNVGAIGHVGNDRFGCFLRDVLDSERTGIASTIVDESLFTGKAQDTLVCFVLVNSITNEHSFCSRYDFGPWPLLQHVHEMSSSAVNVLSQANAVFVNGFVFDEIPEELVVQATEISQSHGAAVLFDPGPRSWTFEKGVRRHALESMLDIADILLMTEEEAGAVVGTDNAEKALSILMSRRNSRVKWCIIKQGDRGALLGDTESGQIYHQEGYSVNVRDTVGCGDSFAAAIALGYIKGKDIRSTLALAGAVGAATAMGTGAGRNVATVSRVVDILTKKLNSCPESSEKILGALGMIGMDDGVFV
jgi:sugar/nucleoside kinase (ribokinase family)